MMYPYPFFRANSFKRPYNYYSPNTPSSNIVKNYNFNGQNACFPNVSSKKEHNTFDSFNKNENKNCSINNTEKSKDNKNSSEEYFEILGLKLHFDDLLIIALLFFLYKEEVKDTYLYIALILLLLS